MSPHCFHGFFLNGLCASAGASGYCRKHRVRCRSPTSTKSGSSTRTDGASRKDSAVQRGIPWADSSYQAGIQGSAADGTLLSCSISGMEAKSPIVYGMTRHLKKIVDHRFLHDKSAIHDNHPVTKFCHNAQIMRDKNNAGAVLFFQFLQSAGGSDPVSSHPGLWSARLRSAAPACLPEPWQS